jgi:uncharacterized FlaG/YvyC family protein
MRIVATIFLPTKQQLNNSKRLATRMYNMSEKRLKNQQNNIQSSTQTTQMNGSSVERNTNQTRNCVQHMANLLYTLAKRLL